MNRLTCLLPIICRVAEAVIAPTAIHKNASDGSLYYNMDQVVAQALTLYSKLSGVSRREMIAASA